MVAFGIILTSPHVPCCIYFAIRSVSVPSVSTALLYQKCLSRKINCYKGGSDVLVRTFHKVQFKFILNTVLNSEYSEYFGPKIVRPNLNITGIPYIM